jgi:hypothetical protein
VSGSAGSGTSVVNVSTPVNNLLPNTKYYYKAMATSIAGSALGSGMFFTTGDAPTLSVTPPNRDVALPAGNTEFYVTSNSDWTVSSDASWCTVTPSGTGNDTIAVSFTENTFVGTRVANISVFGPGTLSQVVTVTQAGIPVILSVIPPNRNVVSDPGHTSFYVTCNTNWNVSNTGGWCSVTPSGSGNDSIYATFVKNDNYYPRVDTIIVSATGAASQRVTVIQAGQTAILQVSPDNQNVSAPTGSTTFSVTSNISWEVSSDTSWCSVTPSGSGNGTIVANFSENLSQQPRVAHLHITSPQVPPAYLEQNVTVTQAKPNNGISSLNPGSIRIYPNPTKGVFRIVPAPGTIGILDVIVEDLNGKPILKKECRGEKEYLIDLSASAQGTYNILLKTDRETVVRKLIIIK